MRKILGTAILLAGILTGLPVLADHGDDRVIDLPNLEAIIPPSSGTHDFDVCLMGDPCEYVFIQESNLTAQESIGDCSGTLRVYKVGKDSTRTKIQPEWSQVWPNGFSTALPNDSHNFVIFNCIDGIPGMFTFIIWQPE